MTAVFPFEFPPATIMYLLLYMLTLVVHVVFMNYVLAGSAYVGMVSLFTGGDMERQRGRIAMILRDWLPAALGAAITAGVAPLLFIQILYKKSFYTANLLLFHRWMAILPVLIVGFYLLYVLKSKRIGHWSAGVRSLVGGGAFLCFAFTGWSWTENHLLSQHAKVWPAFYGGGSMMFRDAELAPRLAVWFLGAIPTCAVLLGWQLRHRERTEGAAESLRALAMAAVIGLVLSVIAAGWYYVSLDERIRERLLGESARPFVILACAGLVGQLIGWFLLMASRRIEKSWLWVATLGMIAAVLATTVLREVVRVSRIDIASLFEAHAAAAREAGFPLFLGFFAMNGLLIAWCVRTVRRNASAA